MRILSCTFLTGKPHKQARWKSAEPRVGGVAFVDVAIEGAAVVVVVVVVVERNVLHPATAKFGAEAEPTLAAGQVEASEQTRLAGRPPKAKRPRQPSYYEVVEEVLSEARKFRCANHDTPCHFFFVDLHSVAKVGITSREVYDLVFADNLGQSTFVLLFTDRDDRRPRSTTGSCDDIEAAEALAARRKAKRPGVYPCRGCHRPFSPPASDAAKVGPPADNRFFGAAEAREEPRPATRRFEISLHQLDVKKRKKPKNENENENEDKDKVGGRDEDKKLVDAASQKEKKQKQKRKEKKVSMKHLMGSALAYFLARLSAYQPARAAGSSTPPDALWVVGKRGGGRSGGMRDLAAQVAEFVAIQRELAGDHGTSHGLLTSRFLGLVDDLHVEGSDNEYIDEGWADLRAASVVRESDNNKKKNEAANATQPDVPKSEGDAAQSGQAATPAMAASIVKIVKRVEKWILKNARNDFKRHKAALVDVDDYRDVVMLPRDRVKLRNFIAPLCRLVRKIDADEVLALLQADGVLGVCGCCRQFKWNERALTSDDCRLERRRRLERERARGIAQGRERMVERILRSLEAKGSRPTNMAELRKVVDNFGDYEEHFDGDQVLQHLINANIIAVDTTPHDDDGDVSVGQRRENVRYVVAQRRIEGMKHQERLERARRRGDQAAWQAELDREKQRREAARQEQQALQQANRERDETERARLREIHARERDEAQQRESDERQRHQERDERKQRHLSTTSQQHYSAEPASSWSSSSSSSSAGAQSLKLSGDQLTAVGGLFASADDGEDGGEGEARWANPAPVSHGWEQDEGGAGSGGWGAEEEEEALDWMASAGTLFDADSNYGGDSDDHVGSGRGRGDFHSEPRQQWAADSSGVNSNNDDGPSLAEIFGGGSGVHLFGAWTTTTTTHDAPAEEEGDGGHGVGVVDLFDDADDDQDGGVLGLFGDDEEGDGGSGDRWGVPNKQHHHGQQKNEDEGEGEGDDDDDEYEGGVGLLFERGEQEDEEEEEEEEQEPTMAGLHYLAGRSFVSTEWNPGF